VLKILSVFGTRPEAIKIAPVIHELERYPEKIESVMCSTGQHQFLLEQACETFGIVPDFELNVMQENQTLSTLTARIFTALDPIVRELNPNWILAQGDTTTTLVASMIAFYHNIPFGHIEAGLRTDDLGHPFPEEFNRRIADSVSKLMFAPTELAREKLLEEGIPDQKIIVTGNTVIDALKFISNLSYDFPQGPLSNIPFDKPVVLVTAHRRENFGKPLQDLCFALNDLAECFRDRGVHFVFPVHPNPNVRESVYKILDSNKNVSLVEPLDYISLVQLMCKSTLVLTDSGGIQEEAPSFGVPVLITRETTERQEGIKAGVAKLVGTSRSRIVEEVSKLLKDKSAHLKMSQNKNPYGDGRAAQRIVASLFEDSLANTSSVLDLNEPIHC
jgi:UDP-N-acetylglucosamine 2-epimerase (non-hydrolysing)